MLKQSDQPGGGWVTGKKVYGSNDRPVSFNTFSAPHTAQFQGRSTTPRLPISRSVQTAKTRGRSTTPRSSRGGGFKKTNILASLILSPDNDGKYKETLTLSRNKRNSKLLERSNELNLKFTVDDIERIVEITSTIDTGDIDDGDLLMVISKLQENGLLIYNTNSANILSTVLKIGGDEVSRYLRDVDPPIIKFKQENVLPQETKNAFKQSRSKWVKTIQPVELIELRAEASKIINALKLVNEKTIFQLDDVARLIQQIRESEVLLWKIQLAESLVLDQQLNIYSDEFSRIFQEMCLKY